MHKFVFNLMLVAILAASSLYGTTAPLDLDLGAQKIKQPNWRPVIVSSFLSGNPHVVLYYEPHPVEDVDIPVKRVLFDEEGNIRMETDLIVLSTVVPHGPSVTYYSDGSIESVALYQEGILNGALKQYYPNGQLKKIVIMKQGILEGPETLYYDTGATLSTGNYHAGKRQGPFRHYHPDGSEAAMYVYEQGLLEGEAWEWHHKGGLKSKQHYYQGRLNNPAGQSAYTAYYPDGTIVALKPFLYGVPHGDHIAYLLNGQESSRIHYHCGKKQGAHDIEENPAEPIVPKPKTNDVADSQAHDENTKLNGEYTLLYQDGSLKQKAFYSDGRLNGEQVNYYPNKQKQAVMNYANGSLHGKRALWDEQGNLMEEANYDDGDLQGRYFLRRPDGSEVIYHYKHHRPHGLHQIYYPYHQEYGKIKALEATYVNGLLEGEVSEFNHAGIKTASTFYSHGNKDGIGTLYTDDGKLKISVEYKNGLQNGKAYEFFCNGDIEKQANFVDGKREGEEKTFFPNGRIRTSYHFRNGMLHGTSREWNEQGILVFEGEFIMGKRHGNFNKYDDNGKLLVLQTYVENELKLKQRGDAP